MYIIYFVFLCSITEISVKFQRNVTKTLKSIISYSLNYFFLLFTLRMYLINTYFCIQYLQVVHIVGTDEMQATKLFQNPPKY